MRIARDWWRALRNKLTHRDSGTEYLAKATEARQCAEQSLKDAKARQEEVTEAVQRRRNVRDDVFAEKVRQAFRANEGYRRGY